jgi:DnaJ-class molecular chaperone
MSGDAFRPFGGDSIAVLGSEDARQSVHATCFADEVVIDFPSVAPAVERMRSAFADEERCAPLRAEMTLSLREAREGATMPLDVPVRCTCRRCGGRGESWAEACARCSGTGVEVFRHQVQVSIPPGVADGARFRFTVATRHDPPTRIELHVAVR